MKQTELNKTMQESGWSVVADPNTAIKIYDHLLDKRNKIIKVLGNAVGNCKPLKHIGQINDIFKNEYISLPSIPNIGYATDNISDKNSKDLIESDLSYMQKIIKDMKASLKGAFSFGKVKKVNFTFTKPERHFITINDIAQYIKSGKAKQTHNNFDDMLAEKTYVVYELKKTKLFTAEFFDGSNNKVELDVKALDNDINGNITVSSDKQFSSKISFEGEKAIIIAFKAAKIKHLGKAYSIFQNKFKSLKKLGFSDTEMRFLYPLIDNLYETEEDFKNALPSYFNEDKKNIIVNHFKFGNFKLDPTDNLHYLDGEHNIENLKTEVPFVSIEF